MECDDEIINKTICSKNSLTAKSGFKAEEKFRVIEEELSTLSRTSPSTSFKFQVLRWLKKQKRTILKWLNSILLYCRNIKKSAISHDDSHDDCDDELCLSKKNAAACWRSKHNHVQLSMAAIAFDDTTTNRETIEEKPRLVSPTQLAGHDEKVGSGTSNMRASASVKLPDKWWEWTMSSTDVVGGFPISQSQMGLIRSTTTTGSDSGNGSRGSNVLQSESRSTYDKKKRSKRR